MYFDKLEKIKKNIKLLRSLGYMHGLRPKNRIIKYSLATFFYILRFFKPILKISNISKMNFPISKFKWIILLFS